MKHLISALVLILTLSACATSKSAVTLPPASPQHERIYTIAKQICPERTVICGIALIVYDAPEYYAGTNGLQIRISRHMVNLAKTEDMLAYILSHEIYHVMMMIHEEQYNKISPHELEFRSDIGGAIIMYCSGFNPDGAIDMLITFSAAFNRDPNVSSESHPSLQSRINNLGAMDFDAVEC